MSTTHTMLSVTHQGHSVGSHLKTNENFASYLDTNHDWIVRRTGIHQRYWCNAQEDAYTLALQAAKNALRNVDPSSITAVFVATCSYAHSLPPLSYRICETLGLTPQKTYDINNACCGFITILSMAYDVLRQHPRGKVLVIGSEHMSRLMDTHDRSTCILFGDGAGAWVVELEQSRIPYAESFHTHPATSLLHNITPKESIAMDGNAVFRQAISSMHRAIKECCYSANIDHKDMNVLVPHQANIRIIQQLQQALLPWAPQVLTSVHKHGNTSAASIPLCLSQHSLPPQTMMLLVAFGAGFGACACTVRYNIQQT